MKKISKRLSKKIVLLLMLSSVVGMQSAWATNYGNLSNGVITITQWEGSNTYSSTKYIGVDGSGSTSLGSNVSNITCNLELPNSGSSTLAGIQAKGVAISINSMSNGITLKESQNMAVNTTAYGILVQGQGNAASVNASGMGTISLETTKSRTYGIGSSKTNSTANVNVNFANGSKIKVFGSSQSNYGIYTTNGDSMTITNLNAIEAGSDTTTGGAAGIFIGAGTNNISFAGDDSSITVKSSGGATGVSITGGTTTLTGAGTDKKTKITVTNSATNSKIKISQDGAVTLKYFDLTPEAGANEYTVYYDNSTADKKGVLTLEDTVLSGKIKVDGNTGKGLEIKFASDYTLDFAATSVEGNANFVVDTGKTLTIAGGGTEIATAANLGGTVSGAGTLKLGDGNTMFIKSSADSIQTTTNQVADNTTLILTGGTLTKAFTKGTGSNVWIGDGTTAADVKATATNYANSGAEIKANASLLLDGNLDVSMNSGEGAIKLNQDVTVADAVTITGTLDANGKNLDMTQDSGAFRTLTVGTLKGTANLKIDLDMSDLSVDKLNVTTVDTGAVIDLKNINVTKDYVMSGTVEFPKTESNAITYATVTTNNGTFKINGKAAGEEDSSITVTKGYEYKFTLGDAGKLNYEVKASDTTFKELVTGTKDITLSLTEDMNYKADAADSMDLGNNMNINLNNHNLTSTYASTVNVVSGKTMSIDGGSGTTAGTLAANYTWAVAEGGTLNLSGKTKVDGTISGAGAVTNTNAGDLTIDAAKLAITNTNGLVNDGTVTIGAGALGSVITGEGKTVINGKVTSDKKITQTQLNIAAGGSLDISVANFDVKNAVENKGTLNLSGGGTIAVPVTGGTTGTTTFKDSNTTMNSLIQTNVTVESGAGLTIKAGSLQGVTTNKGTLTLGDGTFKKDIKDNSGKTIIDGDVNNKNQAASITQKDLTINEGKSLSVNDMLDVKDITNAIDNKGTFAFNGGTLAVGKVTNTATATVKATGNGHVDKGAVTTGTLEFGNNVANATNEYLTSFTNATVKVSEGAKMTLNRGTEASGTAVVLTKKIEGDGTLKFLGTETYETDADNLQIAQSEIATGGKLTLTAGTFIKAMEIAENAEVTLGTNATLGAGSKITGAGKITGEVNFTGEGDVTLNADTFSNNQGLTVNVPAGKTLVLEDGKLTRKVTVADDGTIKLAGAELGGECVTTGILEFGKKEDDDTRFYSVNADYVKTAAKAVDEGVTLAINGTGSDVLRGNISNEGTLEIKDVAAIGTVDKAVDITNDGIMTIDNAGEIVIYGNIKKSESALNTILEIKSGSVVFKGIEIHNPVTIGKGTKFDPVANVFYDEVTNNGNLVLEGGNLNVKVANSGEGNTLTITDSVTLTDAGTFEFDADSTLEIAMSKEAKFFAANEGAVTAATAAIANITNADQVKGIDDVTIKLTGTAENGGYYAVLGSKEGSDNIFILSDNIFILSKEQIDYSADPEITAIELKKIGNALTIQTIKTTKAEENVNCFAGVQQGMISVTNQVTDAVADHLGLLSMNRVENGKYSKGVWASYIRNKDNSDGMNTFSSAADGSKASSLGSNYTSQVNGVTVGADLFASEKAVGGLAINYATGTTTGSGDGAILNNKTKYRGIEFYNRITNKHHAILMDIGYMRGNNEITAADKKNWTADADVNSITAGVRWERDFNLKGGSKLVPFAGLRYIRLQNKDFSNSKGLAYSTNNQNLFQPKLGVAWTGEYKMDKSDWTFKPKAEVGYLWALGNREAETNSQFKSYSAVSKYDVTDKSSYYAKLGMEFKRSNFAAGVDYSYMKGNAVRSNRINVNLSWSF